MSCSEIDRHGKSQLLIQVYREDEIKTIARTRQRPPAVRRHYGFPLLDQNSERIPQGLWKMNPFKWVTIILFVPAASSRVALPCKSNTPSPGILVNELLCNYLIQSEKLRDIDRYVIRHYDALSVSSQWVFFVCEQCSCTALFGVQFRTAGNYIGDHWLLMRILGVASVRILVGQQPTMNNKREIISDCL